MSCECYGVYFSNAQNLEKPKESLSMMGFGTLGMPKIFVLGSISCWAFLFFEKKTDGNMNITKRHHSGFTKQKHKNFSDGFVLGCFSLVPLIFSPIHPVNVEVASD